MRVGDQRGREKARQQVDTVKIALGERGPVWWTDGAPDLNRHIAKNTPYAALQHSTELTIAETSGVISLMTYLEGARLEQDGKNDGCAIPHN